MKKLSVLLLCLCLLFACGCAPVPAGSSSALDVTAAPTQAPTPEPAPEEAEEIVSEEDLLDLPAPGFSFRTTDRDGSAWDEGVFAGYELTMINFWEPWCGPCVGEMPDLQKLSETYADRGLLILGVYSTEGMEKSVDDVLRQTGVTYPILHFCPEFQVFETGYVPTTVFLDRAGNVLAANGGDTAFIGSRSYDGWAAIVEGLL